MLAFFYLLGASFSVFVLFLLLIDTINSSDSFLVKFVITCKVFFLH